MMSVHTSFATHGNLSLSSHDEVGLSSTQFHTSSADALNNVLPRNSTHEFTLSGPQPLPSFVFPAKMSPDRDSYSMNFSKSTTRRPHSFVDLNTVKSIAASVAVTKEEGNNHNISRLNSDNRLDSPPVSPRTSYSRSGYHKWECSEYIGDSSSNTVNSPTNSHVAPALQPTSTASISQRRGHAHRRSAAISTGDLSVILKPNMTSRSGGSLPTSPNPANRSPSFLKSLTIIPKEADKQDDDSESLNTPLKTLRNARVGFSDNVQIIPRPLSLVSCDSTSTIRPEHSVSNSISSIISGCPGSNQFARDKSIPAPNSDARPRTAGPTLEREDPKIFGHRPKRSGSLPTLNDAILKSSSAQNSPKAMKGWSFLINEGNSSILSPKSRPSSAASTHDCTVKLDKFKIESAKSQEILSHDKSCVKRPSAGKKSIKHQKRVKSWAGSILSRKSRHQNHKHKHSRHSPTPSRLNPLPQNAAPSDISSSSQHYPKIKNEPDFSNWKFRNFHESEEAISPIIDLDAALGPFNTPISSFGDFWDSAQRYGNRKKAMHSAAGLGGFSGPGMHYHRRTESAPEFENNFFGFHRLIGSSSSMAMEDVFEEDENEEWEDTKLLGKEVNVKMEENDIESDIESGAGTNFYSHRYLSDAQLSKPEICANSKRLSQPINLEFCTQEMHQFTPTKPCLVTILTSSTTNETSMIPIEVYDDSTLRRDSGPPSSISIYTEISGNDDPTSPEITSTSSQVSLPTLSSVKSTTQSSTSSPITPISYDAQLISAPPTSVKDDIAFETLLLGEPGPELRMSVDDVPSLTRSDSTSSDFTTIGDAKFNNGTIQPRMREGQRSASFSAAKRSSIASLSRLISSSHGEKSKLAVESRAPSYSEGDNHAKSPNKSKRISRLMKFWKKSDCS